MGNRLALCSRLDAIDGDLLGSRAAPNQPMQWTRNEVRRCG
jgi:hypothetical protein